ncbi:hypothetical protein HPP92_028762 [Vanilla planifolia]|uniref:Uncharacterized protein n=1 Tax=Vanilla planifolia TaxID=51239 RepID=A0A835P6H3_VANPL|nr:hypothetical protein HPP92_028762 [Vanilla planifolia]KAG0446607.1 hypothetical protein HPP92_028748 [Vanilla planifolia]
MELAGVENQGLLGLQAGSKRTTVENGCRRYCPISVDGTHLMNDIEIICFSLYCFFEIPSSILCIEFAGTASLSRDATKPDRKGFSRVAMRTAIRFVSDGIRTDSS